MTTSNLDQLQPWDTYLGVADLFIKHLRGQQWPAKLEEALLQGFYIGHMNERNKSPMTPEEEHALSRSWGTEYDIRNATFIRRMKAKFTDQLLIWINSQIKGNNLAADVYLTLLGIEFYKTHKPAEEVSLKWLDDIDVRGKLIHTDVLYKFSRALVVGTNKTPIGASSVTVEPMCTYLWDVMKRADLYACK